MAETRIVRVRQDILEVNRMEADQLRRFLEASKVRLVNIMSSPGSGKTSLILRTLDAFRDRLAAGVIEADMDSSVDADKVVAAGFPAVQIETGGFCHVEAAMTRSALSELPLQELDLVFLENVGNLICTAHHDTGAHVNVAILSVPEGDDKPLKYPLMFTAVDAVVISKTDFLSLTDFDIQAASDRIRLLNSHARILPLSCRTGEGLAEWFSWLEGALRS